MQRRAIKDTIPNLLLEIHMNNTSGQGVNNLFHYPPCASKVFFSPPNNVEVNLLSFYATLLLCVLVSFLAY
jgi:hypothetical protein